MLNSVFNKVTGLQLFSEYCEISSPIQDGAGGWGGGIGAQRPPYQFFLCFFLQTWELALHFLTFSFNSFATLV